MAAKLHNSGVMIQSVRAGSFADLQGSSPAWSSPASTSSPPAPKKQFDAVAGKLKTGDDVVFRSSGPAPSR
jgi:hypothetical protein